MEGAAGVLNALSALDRHRMWARAERSDEPITLTLVGAAALAMYGVNVNGHDVEIRDIDALIEGPAEVRDRLLWAAERLEIPLLDAGLLWARPGWRGAVTPARLRTDHFGVYILDPMDWVLTKLIRWYPGDRADAARLVRGRHLDLDQLHWAVATTLRSAPSPVEGWVRWAWAELAADLGRPDLAALTGVPTATDGGATTP